MTRFDCVVIVDQAGASGGMVTLDEMTAILRQVNAGILTIKLATPGYGSDRMALVISSRTGY